MNILDPVALLLVSFISSILGLFSLYSPIFHTGRGTNCFSSRSTNVPGPELASLPTR